MKTEKIPPLTTNQSSTKPLYTPSIKINNNLNNNLNNDLIDKLKNINTFKDTEQFKKMFQKNYDLLSHDEKIHQKSKLFLDKSDIENFNK